jgi:hypothetical protein
MPLAELLQWLGFNRKTGVVVIERNRVCTQISFQAGRISGCSSDDPSMRLGQILVSRGLILEQTLRAALERQASSGEDLPQILVAMGELTEQVIQAQVASKAAETIQALFQWDDAFFRFDPDEQMGQYAIEVDLDVEGILLEGARRQDELKRIREVFPDSAIVLNRTDQPAPTDQRDAELAAQLLEKIDGRRTLGEILVQARASEFRILTVLFSLHEVHAIEIAEERGPDVCFSTLLGPGTADEEFEATDSEDRDQTIPESSMGAADLQVLISLASDKLDEGDHRNAFTILDTCYRAHPGDAPLKRMIRTAESAYEKHLLSEYFPLESIPVRVAPVEGLSVRDLGAAETSLLTAIGDQVSVQSLIWIAPLRKIEILSALKNLYDLGLILIEGPSLPKSRSRMNVSTG